MELALFDSRNTLAQILLIIEQIKGQYDPYKTQHVPRGLHIALLYHNHVDMVLFGSRNTLAQILLINYLTIDRLINYLISQLLDQWIY